MSLNDEAYLRIDDGKGTIATFQFNLELEGETVTEKNYILSQRGQYLTEALEHLVGDLGVSDVSNRRRGFFIDGGAGSVTHTLTFQTGLEDVTWGDGTGGTGPSNVTTTDASGADVHPLTRKQILDYWVARTRTDSQGQARLHWGEWTNSDFGDAGVFGQPMPVAILSLTTESPRTDDINSMTGTLEVVNLAWIFDSLKGVPDWVADGDEKAQQQTSGVSDR